MSYDTRVKSANYCQFKCLYVQEIPNDPAIPAFIQNTGIQQIKIQKGGTPQFRQFQINQFGRVAGTGGRPPTNFR